MNQTEPITKFIIVEWYEENNEWLARLSWNTYIVTHGDTPSSAVQEMVNVMKTLENEGVLGL